MTLTIGPVKSTDRKAWESLWIGYQAFYGVDLSAGHDTLWKRLLEPGPDGPFALLARSGDGDALALAQYLFHDTTWSVAPRCYLNDLFTVPSARGRGVASALIKAVYEAADARDASQVYWLTQDFNAEARRLYDKLATVTPFIKYAR